MCKRVFLVIDDAKKAADSKHRKNILLQAQNRIANVYKTVSVARQVGRKATVVTVSVYPFGEKTPRQTQITCGTDKILDVLLDEITHQTRKASALLTELQQGGKA